MKQGPLNLDKNIPLALGLAAVAAVYISLLLLSPSSWLPGDPAWAIQPDTIQELTDESLNFFFVLPILNILGFTGMMAPDVHPVTQAFFNFAEAWIFMFLPLLQLDPRGAKLPTTLVWILAMFLTNVFLLPYMAIRLLQEPEAIAIEKGFIAKSFGAVSMIVGGIALFWGAVWQPEVGNLLTRGHFFLEEILSNRVTFAFVVDVILFYCFQIWLMGAIIPQESKERGLRYIPFFGLGLWLLV